MALNPATPPDMLAYVADLVDLVLIMTVNPGWGGQKCITDMVRKVAEVRDIGRSCKRRFELEVDGGITAETAPPLSKPVPQYLCPAATCSAPPTDKMPCFA